MGLPLLQHSNIWEKFHILLVFLEEIKHLLKIIVREIRIKAVSKLITEFGIILKMETKSPYSKYLSYFSGCNSVSGQADVTKRETQEP